MRAVSSEAVDALEQATRRYIQAVRDPDDGREARLPARVLQVADLGAMQASTIAEGLHRDARLPPDAPQLLAEAHTMLLALNRVHAGLPSRPRRTDGSSLPLGLDQLVFARLGLDQPHLLLPL